MNSALILRLVPLFLIALATVAYETALVRFFAVTKWSEYGYWVISIALVGYALSGVAMCGARAWLVRHGEDLRAGLPLALLLTAALGYAGIALNPFNPLQLQNAETFGQELVNIGLYYAVLFPFFFLGSVAIALHFLLHEERIGLVYGMDLAGAGAGAALVLVALYAVHPYTLFALLLPALALAAVLARPRLAQGALALAMLALAEAIVLFGPQPSTDRFKPIYAPLNVPDSREVAQATLPDGYYQLLENFTERVDVDLSNNAGAQGVAGTPAGYGLYRDGNRIATLRRPGPAETAYAPATLDAAPYALLAQPRVLLAGAGGGFRIQAVEALGVARLVVTETNPMLRHALLRGLGPSPAFPLGADMALRGESPVALAASQPAGFDLIDLSADFLDSAEANRFAFTAEALGTYLRALKPGGIVSVPVSIRELPVYAERMLATVAAALRQAGVAEPGAHVAVIRSAWNLRALVMTEPWPAERLAALAAFATERSFDLSWQPGGLPADRTIWNDLPPVDFLTGQAGGAARDAVAEVAPGILAGSAPPDPVFDTSPVTQDRPFLAGLVRFAALPFLAGRLDILPQPEIGVLVNLAVLAQAVLLGLVVLAVPAFGQVRAAGSGMGRVLVYFGGLGLGFLFLEIWLIERASLWLNDRASAFALVLSAMLVCSGLGAAASERFRGREKQGLRLAVLVILGWGVLAQLGLPSLIAATEAAPLALRVVLLLLVTAPLAFALGLPFPLGLERFRGPRGGAFLPWAWGLNGAMSVTASPLANLMLVSEGLGMLLGCGVLLYQLAFLGFPQRSDS